MEDFLAPEPFAKFGVGHEMGAECSCKITPSKGICTWLAMGFPGTTTLPDNKSRFLTNFAKGSPSMEYILAPFKPDPDFHSAHRAAAMRFHRRLAPLLLPALPSTRRQPGPRPGRLSRPRLLHSPQRVALPGSRGRRTARRTAPPFRLPSMDRHRRPTGRKRCSALLAVVPRRRHA